MAKKTHAEKLKELKTLAIAAAEICYHYKIVANAIGKSEDSLKKWRDDDDTFADSLEQARSRFLQKQIAKAKPEFLLERLEPDIFKQRSEQELRNPDGSLAPVVRIIDERQRNTNTE